MKAVWSLTWLRVIREEVGCSLQYDPDVPIQFLRGTRSLYDWFPALVTFLGRGWKDRALRHLFSDHRLERTNGFSLQTDHQMLYSDRPVLFADGDPHQEPARPEPHVITSWGRMPISWAMAAGTQVLDVLLAWFLLPLTHVACIFAADVGGIPGVRALLASWLLAGQDLTLPQLRPRMIIVVESDAANFEDQLLEDPAHAAATLYYPGAPEVLASLHLVHVLSPSNVSDETRFRLLKDEIRKALDLACRDRREGGLQFSAAYLPGIFAARPPSRPEEWISHLGHFLEQGRHLSHEVQDSIIASCLLIEAYPPRTHVLHPHDVFRHRYRPVCAGALREGTDPGTAPRRCRSIETRFSELHAEMVVQSECPRARHARHLMDLRWPLRTIYCNQTCLGCLHHSPQHALGCGHALCDGCVEWCGEPQPRTEGG
ncbi:hypothetical protein BJY01DRAFT_230249, partial [Aspergillus pseudoustus]